MSISLQKGQKVSLSKDNAGLSKILIGLGWDEAAQPKKGLFAPKPQAIDCDASAIMLQGGRVANNADVVYFNNLRHPTGAVHHMGDNLTGAGEGDDEQILVDLAAIPAQYDRIVLVVNIYQARERSQHFGMIQNAFCRIVNSSNNSEICKFNLTENYSGSTALIMGEVYRHDNEWKFNAVGNGTTDLGLGDVVKRYM